MKPLIRALLTTISLSPLPALYGQATGPQQVAPSLYASDQTSQQVTVTADRGLADITDEAASVTVLPASELANAPGLTLDDRLHQVAGFQIFRRTSSWTANPTSQGLSLRGLGSTSASRTLVVSDEVPLNDPFLNVIHWEEIPVLAVRQVQLVRGGAADLYGSSAIGGVVQVDAATPQTAAKPLVFQADAGGASESTGFGDVLLSGVRGGMGALGALSVLQTGGYVATAPAARGLVDTRSNVVAESARLELRAPLLLHQPAFLRGNVLYEARANGTPLQTNGLRLWRYSAGQDATIGESRLGLRLYGSREAYRQSFSAIAPSRNSETSTRLEAVPADEFGVVLSGGRGFAHGLTAAAGVDLHDVRATDDELATASAQTTSISAHQREVGGYFDAIWQPHLWSVAASIRVDSFHTFDARQVGSATRQQTLLPEHDELIPSPRLGLVRQLPHHSAVTATVFRAFRGPSLNELYRTGQVGSQTTLANPLLAAERATGFDFGGETSVPRLGHLRATYFWTEVNRPVSALVLAQTSTAQTLERENLGQIRSRGLMLEVESEAWRGLQASASYQFAVATVTSFHSSSPVQPNLRGNWIPQVPREAMVASINYRAPRLASLHAFGSYTGQQFDDAANQFRLRPYARLDLSVDRSLGRGVSLFAQVQNLLDRAIEAGRTPNLTLASPRLVEAGLRIQLPR